MTIERRGGGSLAAQLDMRVFLGSAILVAPFLVLGLLAPDALNAAAGEAKTWIIDNLGWLYLYTVSAFVFICLAIAVSPLGKIKLGDPDEAPEFGWLAWFAMLFSAGMGIGLVFWSVAEPMYHFISPPDGSGATSESAQLAFQIFFHHWGLHAWATYVIVGLPLAYFHFRKKRPSAISQTLVPLWGDKGARSLAGSLVDILAVWATVMGVVTSLGLGAKQIAGGLAYAYGIPNTELTTSLIIVVITCLFVASAVSGVSRGIKFLSLLNVWLMLALLAFFLLFGPTGYLVKVFFTALGDYLTGLVPQSITTMPFAQSPTAEKAWPGWWTIFYWAWWVAWAPFVGAFIARISRGRTIRQMVLGVMVLPPLFSYLFSTALGGTAVWMDLFEGLGIREHYQSVETVLFVVQSHMPLFKGVALLTSALIASFFITSADSATNVISRFTMGGEGRPDRRLMVFWGVVLGLLAIVLLASGGLGALQTASIVGALPFLFVMIFMVVALLKDLLRQKA